MADELQQTAANEHDEMGAHRRLAAVLIMGVTLVGGVLALIDNRISDHESTYADAAHQRLIQALGDRSAATGSLLLEEQAETAAAEDTALATRPPATGGSLALALSAASRGGAVAVGRYSVLGPGVSVLRAPTTAAVLFQQRQFQPFQRAREQQEADQEASDGFAAKSQNIGTAITILAVSLFLLGLSHTVPASWARGVFTATGVAIAVVAGGWGLLTAARVVQLPSQTAISDYLRADQEITAALNAPADPRSGALLRSAVVGLDRAIRLRPGYTNARLDRADALEQLAQVYSPAPHGSPQALTDVTDAIAKAGDSSVYENVLANIAFWSRRYDQAVAASEREAALTPSSLPAAFDEAQYLELSPRVRPEATARALRLLVRDYGQAPDELRIADYQAVAIEIESVAKYRRALASRAIRWQARLTQLLGPSGV